MAETNKHMSQICKTDPVEVSETVLVGLQGISVRIKDPIEITPISVVFSRRDEVGKLDFTALIGREIVQT